MVFRQCVCTCVYLLDKIIQQSDCVKSYRKEKRSLSSAGLSSAPSSVSSMRSRGRCGFSFRPIDATLLLQSNFPSAAGPWVWDACCMHACTFLYFSIYIFLSFVRRSQVAFVVIAPVKCFMFLLSDSEEWTSTLLVGAPVPGAPLERVPALKKTVWCSMAHLGILESHPKSDSRCVHDWLDSCFQKTLLFKLMIKETVFAYYAKFQAGWIFFLEQHQQTLEVFSIFWEHSWNHWLQLRCTSFKIHSQNRVSQRSTPCLQAHEVWMQF